MNWALDFFVWFSTFYLLYKKYIFCIMHMPDCVVIHLYNNTNYNKYPNTIHLTFARTDFYNSEFMLTWLQTMCMSNTQFCTRYLYGRDLHKSNVMAHHWSTKAKLCGKGSERMVFYLRLQQHFSEIRGLSSMKCTTSKTFQNWVFKSGPGPI